jgi:methionine synthase I (cobalamin-dependent)/5,10-methylenetetrahydrofolate reductase
VNTPTPGAPSTSPAAGGIEPSAEAARRARAARLTAPDDVVLFDGAMGTMLYARGVFINQCYDELCLRTPDLVREVHVTYVKAGAEALETNTFGASRPKLSQYGLEEQVRAINVAGARLAREAAREAGREDEIIVCGAVGPLGLRIEPFGPTAREEAREFFREQMAALVEGGVDAFVLETFGDLVEMEQAIAAARIAGPALPVIAMMTIGEDGRTPYGATAEDVARALDQYGADVVGLNCSVGPQTILEAVERMVPVTRKKVVAMPNAGLPRDVNGRRMYMASAEYFGTYARHLVQAGARVIGGCCGTTPEHIHAMLEGIRPLVPRRREAGSGNRDAGQHPSRIDTRHPTPASLGVQPAPLAERSKFGAKIAGGRFVTSVEIVPPRGVDAGRLLRDAATLKESGVDAINVPDGPRAQSRMGAIATSLLIEQKVGIEAVTHYCCRDRNLLGMLSDLLGASALGLRNLLLITGDPPKMGPYPEATAVFDIDAIGLTNLVANLNRGLDPGQNAIGEPTRFVIGVGVNPAAIDPGHELKRFEYKVQAGAEYAITQPVFDVVQLDKFLATIDHTRIPIIAGIWPLVSARNAEFLANEVPGVTVPDEIIQRMRRANERSKEHAVAEGIAIAREMLTHVRERVQGVQVSAPFGKVELALNVFEGLVERETEAVGA